MRNKYEKIGKGFLQCSIIFAITVVLLILGEITAWLIETHRYGWMIEKGYFNNPQKWDAYRIFWGKTNFVAVDKSLITNSQGYRNREITIKKKYRIVLMGGSFAQGHGASSNSKTISSQLEKILYDRYNHDVEVINAAQAGFTSWQELLLLAFHVIYMDPDFIIVIDGNNEIGVFEEKLKKGESSLKIKLNEDLYGEQMQRILDNHYLNLSPKTYGIGEIINIIAAKSSMCRLVSYFIKKIKAGGEVDSTWKIEKESLPVPPIPDKIIVTYTQNLRMISSIMKSYNIPGLFVLQPHKVFTKHNPGGLKSVIYPRFFAQSSKILSDPDFLLGYSFIDSRKFFEQMPKNIWHDECHMTDKGQKLFAEFVAKNLCNLVNFDNEKPAKFSFIF